MQQVWATAPGAVVLAGDMNAPARGEFHTLLRTTGLGDAFRQVDADFGFTCVVRLGFTQLSYVWGNNVVFTHAQALPGTLRDHHPRPARFGLAEASTRATNQPRTSERSPYSPGHVLRGMRTRLFKERMETFDPIKMSRHGRTMHASLFANLVDA